MREEDGAIFVGCGEGRECGVPTDLSLSLSLSLSFLQNLKRGGEIFVGCGQGRESEVPMGRERLVSFQLSSVKDPPNLQDNFDEHIFSRKSNKFLYDESFGCGQ